MQKEENEYVKRTQKDYTLAFKLQVISEIERDQLNHIVCDFAPSND